MRNKIVILFTFITITAAGQNWQTVGGGANNTILRIYGDTVNNDLYAAGYFSSIGGTAANYIAKWNGTQWDSLGNGFTSLNFGWHCFDMYRGKIVAAGQAFTFSTKHIATWNGVIWDSIGSNFADLGFEGVKTINKELYAFGHFGTINSTNYNGIAKFDTISGSWVSLGFPFAGTSGDPAWIKCVALYHGKLYAAGLFMDATATATANIACYDGSTWNIVAQGITGLADDVFDLEVYQNELYAGGAFSSASGNPGNKIARWNDTIWRDVGGGVTSSGLVNSLLRYNGKLYVGGTFNSVGGTPANYIASWDGNDWCGFGNNAYSAGISSLSTINDSLYFATGGNVWDSSIVVNHIGQWIGGSFVDTCGHINVGINEHNQEMSLSVYPNPAQDQITVEFELTTEENLSIEISDILGQTVVNRSEELFTAGQHKILLNTGDLAKGLYLIKLKGKKESRLIKFMKQ